MNAVKGIVKNGQVVLPQPLELPDGAEVRVEPLLAGKLSDQADDAESIAQWIAEFDAIPPMQMTANEEAKWLAARQAQKDFDKARFFEHADKLRELTK